jgi:DNA end-binding protein Ku
VEAYDGKDAHFRRDTYDRRMARALGSVTLSIGLVSIPAKLYTAQAKKEVSFNRLERATGSRVKQQMISASTGRVLEHGDLVSGFEFTPDQFVTFTAEELKALELESSPDVIRITEVVPTVTIDPTYVMKSVFLGPDKGADRAFALIASRLQARRASAVGQRGGRTRDELVVLSPAGTGLVLHECFYADEVRGATLVEVSPPMSIALSDRELELADKLLDRHRRPSFVAGRFVDGGAKRLEAAVEKKKAGHEIVIPPPRADEAPMGLLEQLQASVARPVRKARTTAPASRTRRAG